MTVFLISLNLLGVAFRHSNALASVQHKYYPILIGCIAAQALLVSIFAPRRWQYTATKLASLLLIIEWFVPQQSELLRLAVSAVVGLLSILSLLITVLVPTKLRMPKPKGPYAVGTVDHLWDFTVSSNGTNSESEASNYPILVKIWYPVHKSAKLSKYRIAEYIDRRVVSDLARSGGSPVFMLSHFPLFSTHSRRCAPLAKLPNGKTFPVVIFSHGLTGVPESYTYIQESLASYGYIVIGVHHTDGSAPVVHYPNGLRISYNPLPQNIDKSGEFEFRNKQLQKRSRDISLVIEKLTQLQNWPQPQSKSSNDRSRLTAGELNNNECIEQFFGRIDLQRIAVIGHSFGGVTALDVCFRDQRVKAGISLDGWFFPMEASLLQSRSKDASKTPFLFINSELWQWQTNLDFMYNVHRQLNALKRGLSTMITLKGSRHHNFNDMGFYFERLARWLKMIGPANYRTAALALVEYSNHFLRYHLDIDRSSALTDNDWITASKALRKRPFMEVIQPQDSATAPKVTTKAATKVY